MKLVERDIGLEVELKENVASVIVLEDINLRISLLEELYSQIAGKDGNWLLVEHEKNYELSKHVELIFEPFSLKLNNKKMKTKLHQDIKVIANDYLGLQGIEIHSHICSYIEILLEKIDYSVKYNNEWDVVEILKAYDIELEECYDNIGEKLYDYIKLMNQVCGIKIFITINLKQYLTEAQLIELYKLAKYIKIQLVLIEFNMHDKKLEDEEIYIIDKDSCIIAY